LQLKPHAVKAMPLRLGTRASALAQWQAGWVRAELQAKGYEVELVLITTMGDTTQGAETTPGQAVAALNTVGVFTKELQKALLDGRIDLAVHSLKDLPTDVVEGLTLAAVPIRETVADVLISRPAVSFVELPQASRVGTGSLRRRAQLLHRRADLRMLDIRGNVETRLRKLQAGEFDAIILAEAGLRRLNLADRITETLSFDLMLPAVGQGALGIETRADDDTTRDAVTLLNDAVSHDAVLAERALLAGLRGGCLAPVAAWCRPSGTADDFLFDAVVLSADGTQRLAVSKTQSRHNSPVQLGQAAADELLQAGAAALIAHSRPTAN
jgi:hydroxymethylbilane synthase